MNVTMKDRVAIVTGGSKGLGLAMARRFAESGARVAIVARGAEDLAAARTALAKDGLTFAITSATSPRQRIFPHL